MTEGIVSGSSDYLQINMSFDMYSLKEMTSLQKNTLYSFKIKLRKSRKKSIQDSTLDLDVVKSKR